MRRASLERERTLHAWREHRWWEGWESPCTCDRQPNRFRKSKVAPNCGIEKWPKQLKIPRAREMRSDASYREWLIELGRPVPFRRSRNWDRW